jgi:glycosyltransferase involved in cell wall biosynthesis
MGAYVTVPSSAAFPGGFTVLMAVYGRDEVKLLERAVRSAFANTLRPDAFLLVVDGPVPVDLVIAIARLETEFNLDVSRLPENRGLAHALNVGLTKVGTEWVVRADADDFNLPERFERLAQAVVGPVVPDLLGSAILEIDPVGSTTAIRRTPLSHDEIVRYAGRRNPFNHMTVAYRSQLARRCGSYPEIYLREDYALWAAMLSEGALTLNLPEVLVHAMAGRDMYRRRGGWRYARAEVSLQRHLVRCGLKNPFSAVLHGLLRGTVFMLPTESRGWIYENILRNRP